MQQITIKLSQEELLYALRTIGEGGLPGMGGAGLAEADAPTLQALTDAGARALMARELLTTADGEQLVIDRAVYSIGMLCAHPEQMVALAATTQGQPARQLFFYRAPELALVHEPLPYGVHRFTFVDQPDMGAAMIADVLATLPAGGAAGTSYTVAQSVLSSAEELAAQDPAAAAARLAEAGLAQADAQAFAAVLAAPALKLLLQLVYRFQPTVEQVVFKLLADGSGCWLVRGDQVATEQVTLQRLPAPQAREILQASFLPFRQAPPAIA